jgi:hypothetical protein
VTAFSLRGYVVRHADTFDDPGLTLICADCPPGANQVAATEDVLTWLLADVTALAQAHHEQHHRAPHLMDRQVQP